MFGDLGWMEILVCAVVGLFVFGPERLPKVASDAAKMLRQLRQLATNATADLRSELGPEIGDIADLHPRRLMAKVLADDDEPAAALAGIPAARTGPVLAPGERPPYDADAT